jgi:hypothetical protein
MLNRKLAAVFVAAAALLAIAPTAGAHKPFREPIDLDATVLPGCSFDVQLTPVGGMAWLTVFDSGRLTIHTIGNPTLTNADTGESKAYKLRYVYQETFDAESNEARGQITGRSLFLIAPGDVGPDGEVDPDGGLVRIVGELRYAADPETFAITSFDVRGRVIDICDELAS